MSKCFLYEQGDAAKRMYRGKNLVFCKIDSDSCPYSKAESLNFAGEQVGIICTSNGLVSKVEEDLCLSIKNPNSTVAFKLRKKARLPIELK